MGGLFAAIRWLVVYFQTGFQLFHLAYMAFGVLLVIGFLDQILLVVAHVAGLLLSALLWLGLNLLEWFVERLPGMPSSPSVNWSVLRSFLAPLNRYFPVAELFSYLGVYVSVATGVFAWKLIKFLRGGG